MRATATPSLIKPEYFFDAAWRAERMQRLLEEAAHYRDTLRCLKSLAIGAGWCCLVVGAGSGETVEWLCRRVGPEGSVLATDLDPRFLYGLDYPNLAVCRHDLLVDRLPGAAFDLVHARLRPQPLFQRHRALARLTGAVRPGGWLIVETLEQQVLVGVPAGNGGRRSLPSGSRRSRPRAGRSGSLGRGRENAGHPRLSLRASRRAKARHVLADPGWPTG